MQRAISADAMLQQFTEVFRSLSQNEILVALVTIGKDGEEILMFGIWKELTELNMRLYRMYNEGDPLWYCVYARASGDRTKLIGRCGFNEAAKKQIVLLQENLESLLKTKGESNGKLTNS